MKYIKRGTARLILEDFLSRIEQLNCGRNPFVYKVDKAILFGSFLNDKEKLGDIDIALSLVPTENDSKKQMEFCLKRIREAKQSRRFDNIFKMYAWPEEEVLKFLRNRRKSISFHFVYSKSFCDIEKEIFISKHVPYKVIYTYSRKKLSAKKPRIL